MLERNPGSFLEKLLPLVISKIIAIIFTDAARPDLGIDRQDKDAVFAVAEDFNCFEELDCLFGYKAVKIVDENDAFLQSRLPAYPL